MKYKNKIQINVTFIQLLRIYKSVLHDKRYLVCDFICCSFMLCFWLYKVPLQTSGLQGFLMTKQ